jgi:hypothetical protein
MAQRIVRAKRKIAAAGIPFRVPREDLLVERVDGGCSTGRSSSSTTTPSAATSGG